MNEQQFGNKIRQILSEGARGERLGAHVRQRLHAARERALARARTERAPAMAWAGDIAWRFGGLGGLSARLLLPIVVLIIGLAAIFAWERNQRVAEVEEIDALLLSSDLPIDAYLDSGFEAWLKKRNSR
jgi:hypothetical protein